MIAIVKLACGAARTPACAEATAHDYAALCALCQVVVRNPFLVRRSNGFFVGDRLNLP